MKHIKQRGKKLNVLDRIAHQKQLIDTLTYLPLEIAVKEFTVSDIKKYCIFYSKAELNQAIDDNHSKAQSQRELEQDYANNKAFIEECKHKESQITPTPTPTPTPQVAKMKEELAEVKAIKEEVEIEIARTEALQAKLDETRKQIAIQAEIDSLNQAELEHQVKVQAKYIATTEKLEKQVKRLKALTEIVNQFKADIRIAQNLDRAFTHHQKREIYLNAGGKCQQCGSEVAPGEWEADHIIAYSKGGPTTIANGQCLCRSCNRQKGDK